MSNKILILLSSGHHFYLLQNAIKVLFLKKNIALFFCTEQLTKEQDEELEKYASNEKIYHSFNQELIDSIIPHMLISYDAPIMTDIRTHARKKNIPVLMSL